MSELSGIANNMRKNIVKMVHNAQSGHPGGSLSCVDILAVLYFKVMNINKDNLNDTQRDKFILSKGHASPAIYSVLAEKGFISEEELLTYRIFGSRLQGHPNMNDCPGIDMSTGSLGQGLSVAVGMSLANKLDNNDYRTYVLLGDGECDEGMVWEAAMAAAHYNLDNLLAIVDHNGLQIDGKTSDVMNTSPLGEKFASFGWNVFGVDGHDHDAIEAACKAAEQVKGKPTVIIAETVKGKGISYMENQAGWHGKAPNDEQLAQALEELGREGRKFDLIFMDPPYKIAWEQAVKVAELIDRLDLLKDGGKFIVEHSSDELFNTDVISLKFVRSCSYGLCVVTFFNKSF